MRFYDDANLFHGTHRWWLLPIYVPLVELAILSDPKWVSLRFVDSSDFCLDAFHCSTCGVAFAATMQFQFICVYGGTGSLISSDLE